MRIESPYEPGQVLHPDETTTEGDDESPSVDSMTVINTGTHIVQIGSHYHFFEANPVLSFDREAAYGMRLDVPAGDRVYFPPGERTEVSLVPIGGDRRVRSFYRVVDGRLDEYTPAEALSRLRERLHEPLASSPDAEPTSKSDSEATDD
jgi:urease subunit beta